MTQAGYSHIDILLDRSGSMESIKTDMEGGIKTLLDDQRNQSGRATVAIRQFDTIYEVMIPPTPIEDVDGITLEPRGGTALLDAMGQGITECGEWLSRLDEDQRPEHVFYVIITDGEENSSQEWKHDQVMKLVNQQQTVYGWTFVYLGANQDAIKVGASLGVANNMGYAATSAGVYSASRSTSDFMSSTRSGGSSSLPQDAEGG